MGLWESCGKERTWHSRQERTGEGERCGGKAGMDLLREMAHLCRDAETFIECSWSLVTL